MYKALSFLPAVVFVLLSFNPSPVLADGACCRSNIACTDVTDLSQCDDGGAGNLVYLDGISCTSAENDMCAVGACCTGDSCIDGVTNETCKSAHTGSWNGPGSTCADSDVADNPACVEAEPTLACCHFQHPTSHICSDLSAAECENAGGTAIGDDCTDDNLDACPAAPATIACCIDEDVDGVNDTCSDLIEEACVDAGGTNIGTACGASDVGECPATVIPTGACCLPNGECQDSLTEGTCDERNGSFGGNYSVCEGTSSNQMNGQVVTCNEPVGACCLPNGDCQDSLTEGTCAERNGSFGGINTVCDDPLTDSRNEIICSDPKAGACCFPNGDCQDEVNDVECEELGGAFSGAGTTCDDGSTGLSDADSNVICPVLGACCSHDGCIDVSEEACLAVDGNQFVDTSLCAEIVDVNGMCASSEPTIACCVGDQCVDVTAEKCEDMGGVSVGTDCDQDHIQCPVVAVGACCTADGYCIDGQLESDCIESYGDTSYQGDGTNCRQTDIQCTESPDLIACCSGDECLDVTVDECRRIRGVVVGSSCDQDHVVCPVVQVGACCTEEGCTDAMLESDCIELHGDNAYQGDGTHCRDSNVQCEEVSFTKACCLPSGSCVNALPEECERASGTIVGENCEDDNIICEGPMGACCTNNGFAGPGCVSDQTLEECRALDGVYLGDGAMCTDDVDCGQYFNNEPTGGCCLPDGSCEDNHTFKDCVTQLQGSWLGENMTCEEADDCAVPTSACCLDDGCIETTAENCHFLGGTAVGDDIADCVPGLCLEALGSCCTASGCLNLTETACEQRNGTFDPDSSHCLSLDSDFCPTAAGACCTASGCFEITEESCADENGTYYGNGVLCTDANVDCIDSEGACCIDGQCLSLTSSACETLGGQYYGANVGCDDPDVVCEALPEGACCGGQNTAPCFDAEEGKCLAQGGQWFPDVSCDDTDPEFQCPVMVACCLPQGDCVDLELGRCEEMGGVNAGDNCEGPGDEVVECTDTTTPQGGCCLPSGECTYMGEEACLDVSGLWLGEDQPCPEDINPGGVNGTIISTGWDINLIGDFNNRTPVPTLWPNGAQPATAFSFTSWMADNEPTTNFSDYYFQYVDQATSGYPMANQTAPHWDCAGDFGSRLGIVLKIKMNTNLEDPALRGTEYFNFQDLLNALMSSPYYAGELQTGASFNQMAAAIAYSSNGSPNNPWIIYHDSAEDCFEYENPDIPACPLAEDGACCLPSGECVQLSEEGCEEITGEWLGSGVPCPQTVPVGTGQFASTGWDINEIGSYNYFNPVPTVWNPETISTMDYVQALSLAEPATPFGDYYFEEANSPAPAQDSAPYWCAGDNGNRLSNVWYIRLEGTLEDPALRHTEYYSFAELLNALSYSSFYADELSPSSDWLAVADAISYVDDPMTHPYTVIGRPGLRCFDEVEITEGACPSPIACCVDGGCYQLSEHACLERGGIVVGEDCNDEDIECGDGNNDDPGACCAEGVCINVDAETCHITYQGAFYNDSAQCTDECVPLEGACCLEDGSCIDSTENGCEQSDGDWLGANTDCQSLLTASGGGLVSTGWDIYATGNFGTSAALAPYGGAPTTMWEHLQWMSLNEPQSSFSTYYHQDVNPATQTAAASWHCAGDQGNRIRRTFSLQINDSLDPALSYTSYYTFDDLLNAMIGSSAYPSVNQYSTFYEVKDAIHLGNSGSNVMSIYGQFAQQCFENEESTFQCPVKVACCVDGMCDDLTEEDCLAQGGVVVGDDCDDSDIICEDTDVPCCINGTCIVIDETECLASGGALAGAACETDNICPQPTGACCIDDTCVDNYDAVKCEQEGGMYYGNGTDCTDPNIMCGGGDKGGCCMEDGSCVDTSYGDCAENGGNYLGDGVLCSEQTDAGLCPSPTIGACCIDGQCSETTAEKCHYFGGQYFGDGADCVPGLCDSENGLGGCCVQGSCVEPVSEASCENHSGAFYPNGCDDEICGGVHRGACCVDGTCSVLYESDCEALGGSYLGDDVPCTADTQCPDTPGACCMPDGSCQEEEREQCDELGGLYLGADCQDAQCPTPSGACCMPDGNCAQMPEDECKHLLGSYQGHGTDCVDVQCTALDGGCGDETAGSSGDDPLGACCTDTACVESTSDDCTESGGLWAGADSTCDEEDICRLGTSTPVESGGMSCHSSSEPPVFLLGFLFVFGLFRRRFL